MKHWLAVVLVVAVLLGTPAVMTSCGGDSTETTAATVESTATTEGAGSTEGDTGTTMSEVADGAQVFATTCAGCHGADGTGGSGPDLTTRTDLTQQRIVDQVTNGGPRMPSYAGTLSEGEINAVADYVLSDIVKK